MPLLTVFSTPKAFSGHIGLIQRNAIRSWMRLDETDVLLLGDDEGVEEFARRVGARHLPDIALTESGTPRVDSVFAVAEAAARSSILCYVNADIVLPGDFTRLVTGVSLDRFLIVGQRWDYRITEELDFSSPETEARLHELATDRGALSPHFAIDYFVFTKGLPWGLPPFALGRTLWDNWIIYRARKLRIPVIDATALVTAVHQSHDYSHARGGESMVWKGPEAERNRELGALDRMFSVRDADYVLTEHGVRRAHAYKYLRQRLVNLPLLYPAVARPYRRVLAISRRLRGLT